MSNMVKIENIPIDVIYDATTGDSDKSWQVGTDAALVISEYWKLDWIQVVLVSSLTVGTRALTLGVINLQDQQVLTLPAGATQTVGQTRRYVGGIGLLTQQLSIAGVTSEHMAIPDEIYVENGYKLRIYDANAVDPTGDDMTVSLGIKRYVRRSDSTAFELGV